MATVTHAREDMQQAPDKGRVWRFQWRALLSVTTALSFVAMSVTGVVLFVTPPGRVAHWTGWTIWGLTKEQWSGLHIWFSLLFMAVAVPHLYLNWRVFLSYFRRKAQTTRAFRLEWLAALLLCGVVWLGTLARVPPFSSLLSWNESVKQSWERPMDQAPIPHAELMTLTELAAQTGGSDPESMARRLRGAGIEVESSDDVLGDIARRAGMTPMQLYTLAVGQSVGGQDGQRGASGRDQQTGSGMGALTLQQYCERENLDVAKTVLNLRDRGFKAEATMTLREIAVNGGVHPSELREILSH